KTPAGGGAVRYGKSSSLSAFAHAGLWHVQPGRTRGQCLGRRPDQHRDCRSYRHKRAHGGKSPALHLSQGGRQQPHQVDLSALPHALKRGRYAPRQRTNMVGVWPPPPGPNRPNTAPGLMVSCSTTWASVTGTSQAPVLPYKSHVSRKVSLRTPRSSWSSSIHISRKSRKA